MKRRQFIQSTVAAGAAATPLARALAETGAGTGKLIATPRDYEGPYYPKGPRNRTHDLITGPPRGKVLQLRGQVLRRDRTPMAGVLLDIWQTDMLGRYRHPADSSDGERWDDFLYWGEASADEQGQFAFRTYVPGAYGRRPAHIHYKVWQAQEVLLTSQVYFEQLGGTRNRSMSSHGDAQQTTRLVDVDPSTQQASFLIVI